MNENNGRKRITVDLGSLELYRALKFAAIERGVAAREIVVDALQEWLERNYPSRSPDRKGKLHDH